MTSFSVAPVDDYQVFFDLRVLHYLRPIIVLDEKTIIIVQVDKPCIVIMCHGKERSLCQFERVSENSEPTFMAILNEDDPPILEHKLDVLIPAKSRRS